MHAKIIHNQKISAVFSQKVITTNFSKMFFLQFSTQKLMFHHLCKNQTHALFTFVIGVITTRKNFFRCVSRKIFLLVLTTIVVIMSFYDIIKSQEISHGFL